MIIMGCIVSNKNSYVEALFPSTSECELTGKIESFIAEVLIKMRSSGAEWAPNSV